MTPDRDPRSPVGRDDDRSNSGGDHLETRTCVFCDEEIVRYSDHFPCPEQPDAELSPDGGVEATPDDGEGFETASLRDGEVPDRDAHAARNAEMKKSLRAELGEDADAVGDLRRWGSTDRVTVRVPDADLEALTDDPNRSAAIRKAMAEYCDEFARLIIEPRDAPDASGDDLEGVDVTRVTFRCPTALLDDMETLLEYGLAANRSRAIRDAIRYRVSDDEEVRL